MEVLKEDESDELLNEELVLPWHTNLAEKTRADYFHDSRWFLEFAGFLDPSKVNHKPGNRAPEVKALQHAATEAAFAEFLKQAHNRPRWATLQLLRFARQTKERVDRHELGPMEVRQRLAPFKKAFDVNGIAIPWKKITAIFPRYKRSTDREYRLDELQLLCSKGALHLRVAMLLMSGSGLRVGAFGYANFRNYTQFSVNMTITEPTNSFSSPPVVHMISSADSFTANMSTAKDEFEIIISQTSTDIIASYYTISSTGSVLHSFNLDQPFSGVTLAPPYHHYAVSDAIEGLDPNEGYAIVNSGTDFQIESLISPSTITDFTGHKVQNYTGGAGNNGLTVSCTNANIGSYVDEEGNSATYTLPTTWHGTSTSGNEVYQYYEVT